MALPVSAASWKYVKFLVRASEYAIPAGLAWMSSLADDSADAAPVSWMRYVVTWSRTTPTGTTEDKAQFKLDLLNITSGAIDTTWTAGDFATVKAAVDTWVTATLAKFGAAQTYAGDKAYRMSFNPEPDLARPFADTGSPVYAATRTTAMTGGIGLPYQVAQTVTFRTAWPRHWGRVYLPTPDLGGLDTNGRFVTGQRSTVANATKALASTLADAGFLHVVPVGQIDKTPFHALLGVGTYQVDDIPDVQRRRRPRTAAFRTIGV